MTGWRSWKMVLAITMTLLLFLGPCVLFSKKEQVPVTKKDADELIGKLREARQIEIEILDPMEFSQKRVKWITAYTSSDPAEIAELAEAISVDPRMPQRYSGFQGGPIIRFRDRAGQEDKIVFHAGKSISSPHLLTNLWLINIERLDAWFIARGMPPIDHIRGGWFARAPASIRSQLVPAKSRYSSRMHASLELEFPDPVERCMVLFDWYGSGSLRWDDANDLERIAFQLLSSTDPHDIVSAINSESDTPMASHVRVGVLRFLSQVPKDTQREMIGQINSKAVAELVDTAKTNNFFFEKDHCMQLLEQQLLASSKQSD